MLILIHDRFKTNLLFFKQGLTRIPYYFNGKSFLSCNFDDSYDFQLITKQEINLEAFTSWWIKFQFSLYLKQMLIFEPTENIQGLASDIAAQNPGFYDFQELILHNYRNENITIPQNIHLGVLSIKSFQKNLFVSLKKWNKPKRKIWGSN